MKVKFNAKGLNLDECKALTPEKEYEVVESLPYGDLYALLDDKGRTIHILVGRGCAHLDWSKGLWEVVDE